ncbi:hypothetical protein Bbelb_124340 [Branchiostoma belcheri]|nr:hypothetical protein Bbelb_124340 [Branchiostoma belcheri]
MFPNIYTLSVDPPVVLNITSPRFTTVGATVTLWCIVDGNPTPKVLWYKSGNSQPIGLSSTLDHIVSYLTLHDLQTSDSGEYLCRAFNGKYRNDSRAVELTVLGEGTASYSTEQYTTPCRTPANKVDPAPDLLPTFVKESTVFRRAKDVLTETLNIGDEDTLTITTLLLKYYS